MKPEIPEAPVRTRGAIRTRGGPLLVRGAVRTRGAAVAPTPARDSVTLDGLLTELRKEAGELPLTVVVHGWDAQSAGEFLEKLVPSLHQDDAVWLAPPYSAGSAAPEQPEGLVVLDPNLETDNRLLAGMVASLVFLPGRDAAEESDVASNWRQRTSTLVVFEGGAAGTPVIQAANRAGIVAYRWSGQNNLLLQDR